MSLGKRSSAPRRRSNHSGHGRGASVFRRASGRVAEYFRGMGRKVPWPCDCRHAPESVGQVGTGRATARMESCRRSPPLHLQKPQQVSVTGSAEFQRNGTSRRDPRSSNRRRLRRLPETAFVATILRRMHSESAKLGHTACVGRCSLAATARIYVSQADVDVGMPAWTDAEQQRIARFRRSSQTFSLVGGHTAEPCVPQLNVFRGHDDVNSKRRY